MRTIKFNTPVLPHKIRVIINDGKQTLSLQTTGKLEFRILEALISSFVKAKRTRSKPFSRALGAAVASPTMEGKVHA